MQADSLDRPFAVQLLEQHREGKTVEQLSRETGIPYERIRMRLEAAETFLQKLSVTAGSGAPRGWGRSTQAD